MSGYDLHSRPHQAGKEGDHLISAVLEAADRVAARQRPLQVGREDLRLDGVHVALVKALVHLLYQRYIPVPDVGGKIRVLLFQVFGWAPRNIFGSFCVVW